MEIIMKNIIPFFTVILLFSCASFDINKRPTAKVTDQQIESISIRDINLLFDVEIANPYPIGFKLSDVEFVFFVEGKQFFKTNTGKGLSIKANGKETSPFRVNLKYEDIFKIVKDYANKDYLDCKIDIKVLIPLPGIPGLPKDFTVRSSVSKKLPAIKPAISVDNFKIKKPGRDEIEKELKKKGKTLTDTLTGLLAGKKPDDLELLAELDLPIHVDFDIVMKNNSRAKLLFSDFNYNFFVEKEKLIGGITKDIENRDNKSTLRISNTFSSKTLTKGIIKVLKNGRGAYMLKGETSIKIPDQKRSAKFVFDEKGSFDSK
jgi:LEA14-like dessication related protein